MYIKVPLFQETFPALNNSLLHPWNGAHNYIVCTPFQLEGGVLNLLPNFQENGALQDLNF